LDFLDSVQALSNKVRGFANLAEEERDAIVDFSFLWSLFEGKVMDGRCDVPRIRNYVQQLDQQDRLSTLDCEPYIEYLKNRYFRDGEVTGYYHGLHLERSGNPEEVLELLRNVEVSKVVKVIGSLIIIYRLRNNLFHGEKWQYDFEGQLDNFTQANNYLKTMMQLN
jgi:hypothetical protein